MSPARSFSAHVPGALLAVCALGASAQSLGLLDALPRALLAVPLVLLGAAWPIVVARAPHEPSLLKLVVLASLLSPPLCAASWSIARAILPPDRADALVYACFALLQLLALGKRIELQPAGIAASIALALSAAAAAAIVIVLASEDVAVLLARPGVLWHGGVAQALERGLSPENPWLAGTRVTCDWSFDAVLLVVARAADAFPARALIVLSGLAALASGACLYLIGAPLWRETRRAMLVPLFAFVGPHALAGVELAFRRGPRATLSADAGIESGLSSFLEIGPTPFVLALCLGLWTSAAHAIRHGRAPWVGLCAAFALAAVAIDPVLGIAAVLPVATGAALGRGERGARERVLGALLLALLPALALASLAGWETEPVPRSSAVVEPAFALDALLLLCACALPLARGRWIAAGGAGDERGRRAIAGLLVLAVAAALVLPWTSETCARRQVDLVRLASLAAAPLAAGGIVDLWSGRAPSRLLAFVLFALLVAGGSRRAAGSLASPDRSGPAAAALAIEDGALVAGDGDLARAYRWIRGELGAKGEDPVLVRSVWRPEDHLDRNRLPHVAPLLTHLSLWCDRRSDHVRDTERWKTRHDALEKLFGESVVGEPDTTWDPRTFEELDRRGRPLLILIEDEDRRSSRMQIERRLPLLGAERIHEEGSVSVWRRDPRGGGSR